MTPALWIGAVVVGLGALAAFAIPRRGRLEPVEAGSAEPLAAVADAA